ncbi:Very-long-chain 3-oxoacyl-CoA reductase, partial [Lachnellula suecica]
MAILTNILTSIGALWLSSFLFKTARFIRIYMRRSSLPRYHHASSSGSPAWALITGASDGIGSGYAHELARHSFNLILHGRNPTKLLSVQKSILALYPTVQIKLMVLDASTCSAAEIEREVAKLRELHVTVLVNNVGTGTTPSGHVFANLEDEETGDIDALINTNARFPALLTHFVLPLLLSHKKPALILNMGSISDTGSPYLSVYSATKAFDTAFSKALRREMKAEGTDVEVLAIMTAQVTGTGTNDEPVSVVMPDAGVFARSALARVGVREGGSGRV